jgi:hypothetical protein
VAVLVDVGDELLIFLGRPWPFLQALLLLAAGDPPHSIDLSIYQSVYRKLSTDRQQQILRIPSTSTTMMICRRMLTNLADQASKQAQIDDP